MKMTKNRLLILRLLDEEMEGSMPPHSVSNLHYAIETLVKYKWPGYPDVLSVPDKRNINRTCVDLLNAGLVVVSRIKYEPIDSNLPYWEKEYQLASSVGRNFIITECDRLYRAVNTAKEGVNFFGALLNRGLQPSAVKALEKRIRVMLQRTHPDKTNGLEEQFKRMNKAKAMIKLGIPLPDDKAVSASTPTTHQLKG